MILINKKISSYCLESRSRKLLQKDSGLAKNSIRWSHRQNGQQDRWWFQRGRDILPA